MDSYPVLSAIPFPCCQDLRQSAIHNDANDYNVLVSGDQSRLTGFPRDKHPTWLFGLVDFGDMVHSFTVGDLAVAIAYAILDKPDPLAAAAQVAAGYHERVSA